MLDQRKTGLAIIAFAAVIFAAVLLESLAFQQVNILVHADCNLAEAICPANAPLPSEAYMPLTFSIFLGVFGLYLYVSSRQPAIRAKPAPPGLEDDESRVYAILSSSGALLQSDIIEKTGIQKVRMTRILDKLEAKQLIERQRRGMTNLVKLKA